VNSSDRGFTLIEVMVALTLLGVIATLVASGTRLTLDLSARGNASAEKIRNEQIERRLLTSQLQEAIPLHYWTEVENKRVDHVAFDGEPDRIRFVSRHGISDGPGSLPRWVHLQPQKIQDGSTRLVLEEHRILPPSNEPSENVTARAEVLNCTTFRFEYLDTTGEKPQWTASWIGTERKAPLPFAVRIQCKGMANTVKFLIPLDYAASARQGLSFQ
jgi:general secretion pathway protein J